MIGTQPHTPTIDVMESRLLAWAAYRSSGGSGEGYPTTNVLDASWMPPSPGMRPSMRVSTGSQEQERQLDERIQHLSVRLRDTLYVVYLKRMPAADQVQVLQCQASTIRARVIEAKRLLSLKS